MPDVDDELRILRERLDALEQLLDQVEQHAPTGATVLGLTSQITSYPGGTGQKFVAVTAQVPGGAEKEGGQATFTAYGQPFLAISLGNAVPALNTYVIVEDLGGRAGFLYNL